MPPTDPCVINPSFSWPRFLLFTAMFLIMLPGSLSLLFFVGHRPYGIQFASAVSYSSAVVLYTFSSNRGMQRYLFRCPFVRPQLPQLAVRHTAFLLGLFVLLQTAAFLRPHLPIWWLTASGQDAPPCVIAIFVFVGILALTEVITNRSLLDRAHSDSPLT